MLWSDLYTARVFFTDDAMFMNLTNESLFNIVILQAIFLSLWFSVVQTKLHFICLTGNFRKGVVALNWVWKWVAAEKNVENYWCRYFAVCEDIKQTQHAMGKTTAMFCRYIVSAGPVSKHTTTREACRMIELPSCVKRPRLCFYLFRKNANSQWLLLVSRIQRSGGSINIRR